MNPLSTLTIFFALLHQAFGWRLDLTNRLAANGHPHPRLDNTRDHESPYYRGQVRREEGNVHSRRGACVDPIMTPVKTPVPVNMEGAIILNTAMAAGGISRGTKSIDYTVDSRSLYGYGYIDIHGKANQGMTGAQMIINEFPDPQELNGQKTPTRQWIMKLEPTKEAFACITVGPNWHTKSWYLIAY